LAADFLSFPYSITSPSKQKTVLSNQVSELELVDELQAVEGVAFQVPDAGRKEEKPDVFETGKGRTVDRLETTTFLE
jgi:hypothetical protein